MPYACKRTQLAATGCGLGATCGIIRVSYHLKVGLDRDYSPRCFFLADTLDNVGVCYTKPLHWELRHAAHDSERPQKRRRGTRTRCVGWATDAQGGHRLRSEHALQEKIY